MTHDEAAVWDEFWDTDAAHCCSCPSCNYYALDYEQHKDEPCLLTTLIERIIAARAASAQPADWRRLDESPAASAQMIDWYAPRTRDVLCASTPPAEPAATLPVAGECLDCYGDEGICDECPAGEGCDCTELCSMGPTCPGGMLAGLAGSGCWRSAEAAATGAVEALAAPAKEPLRAHAYYYGFDLTGVGIVDRILSEVCAAGKGYHHTEMWGEEGWDGGPSYVDRIQKAADDAAAAIRAAVAASQPAATPTQPHDNGDGGRV